MSPGKEPDDRTHHQWAGSRRVRLLTASIVVCLALTQIPVVSAHGGSEAGGLSQWHGAVLAVLGFVSLGTTVLLKQTNRISPTIALYGVFAGLFVTVLGAVLFEGLAPDPTYDPGSMPFPRSWYQPLGIVLGTSIASLSVIIGWIHWPRRPRYMFLGVLTGLWVLYPYLLPEPASYWNPLGYAIVLVTPLLIGYILWKDAGSVIRTVLQEPASRRFGVGVGVLTALFFMATSGYISVFWQEGGPEETTVAVLPAVYQLVSWPTLEVALPQIPLFFAMSPGVAVIVGLLSGLIGLNAALIAQRWLAEQRAGATQGSVGTATIVGACTCGCCGPLVSQVAILAAGPTVAAPLYWLFVDSASPFSTLFVILAVVVFVGTLLYTINSERVSAPSSGSVAD
jgi:uncharacterized membrane protein